MIFSTFYTVALNLGRCGSQSPPSPYRSPWGSGGRTQERRSPPPCKGFQTLEFPYSPNVLPTPAGGKSRGQSQSTFSVGPAHATPQLQSLQALIRHILTFPPRGGGGDTHTSAQICNSPFRCQAAEKMLLGFFIDTPLGGYGTRFCLCLSRFTDFKFYSDYRSNKLGVQICASPRQKRCYDFEATL